MSEAINEDWLALHQRAARGENLTSEERAVYEAGLTRRHQEEVLDNGFADLSAARIQVAALEKEQSELKAQRDFLEIQINSLEAALSERTREALGVVGAKG